MSFEIKINNKDIEQIKKRLKLLKRSITNKKLLMAVLLKIKNSILLRTNAGVDADMKPFRSYSPKYAKEEGKTTVNLTRTQTMLNAMTQKMLNNTTGLIFFNNVGYRDSKATTQELARYHNEGDGVPRRHFFGVNQMDNKLALKMYKEAAQKAIKKRRLT